MYAYLLQVRPEEVMIYGIDGNDYYYLLFDGRNRLHVRKGMVKEMRWGINAPVTYRGGIGSVPSKY